MGIAPKPNNERAQSKSSNCRTRLASSGLVLALGLLASAEAAAETLDSATLQNLALQGTWAAEDAEIGYWSWNKDKTVCLRIGSAGGNCADTGTWKINDNVICYELSWWGESNDDRKSCFTVQAHGDGRYETLYHGGAMVSTYYYFNVLE
jgi:hypothetical protein